MTKKTSLWQRLKNAFSDAKPNTNLPNPNENHPFSQDLTGQVIVDLTQQSSSMTDENSQEAVADTVISADDIDVMLTSMGYHFTFHPPHVRENADLDAHPVHHFTMQVADGERDWGCLLRYFETEQLLAVYSIFPFSVPEPHRGEMLAVLAYLNYDLVIGNLELDIYDGEVRFKTSLDLEVTGLSVMILSYLLQSNFSVTSRLHDTLADVIAKPTPAENASEAVANLLSAQQEKTFYLMTETLQ